MNKFKLISVLLIIMFLVSLLSLVSMSISAKRYKKEYESKLQSIRFQKQVEIKKANDKIIELLKDNLLKGVEIERANRKIDSLENVKSNVKIKYEIRYKEIEKYNSEEILKYWQNELK